MMEEGYRDRGGREYVKFFNMWKFFIILDVNIEFLGYEGDVGYSIGNIEINKVFWGFKIMLFFEMIRL